MRTLVPRLVLGTACAVRAPASNSARRLAELSTSRPVAFDREFERCLPGLMNENAALMVGIFLFTDAP